MKYNGLVEKILVVDDDAANRLLLECYLENFKNVYSVASGDEAVRAASEEKYDLILMDINLGASLSGQEVTRIIRDGTLNAKTPIFAVTAQPKNSLNMDLFDDYVSKPVNMKLFYDKVYDIFDK